MPFQFVFAKDFEPENFGTPKFLEIVRYHPALRLLKNFSTDTHKDILLRTEKTHRVTSQIEEINEETKNVGANVVGAKLDIVFNQSKTMLTTCILNARAQLPKSGEFVHTRNTTSKCKVSRC